MISEIAAESSGASTRKGDPDAAYREDVLSLLAHLDVEPTQAIAFIESGTGLSFETCTPGQLVPLLEELLEVVRSHRIRVGTGELEP